MKTITQLIQSLKEKNRIEKDSNIQSRFQVVEADGCLWLAHDGIAFLEFSKDARAEDVTDAIEKARKTAIKFDRL